MNRNTGIGIVFLSVLFTACGPRSGIHHESGENEPVQPDNYAPVCGNAERDAVNYSRAEKLLCISGDGERGVKLFKQNCAVCHVLTDMKLTGPGLRNLYSRLPEPKTEWLRQYILNSEEVYKSGDPYAKKLRKAYPEISMTIFEGSLSDKDLNDLMIYVIGNTQ